MRIIWAGGLSVFRSFLLRMICPKVIKISNIVNKIYKLLLKKRTIIPLGF